MRFSGLPPQPESTDGRFTLCRLLRLPMPCNRRQPGSASGPSLCRRPHNTLMLSHMKGWLAGCSRVSLLSLQSSVHNDADALWKELDRSHHGCREVVVAQHLLKPAAAACCFCQVQRCSAECGCANAGHAAGPGHPHTQLLQGGVALGGSPHALLRACRETRACRGDVSRSYSRQCRPSLRSSGCTEAGML